MTETRAAAALIHEGDAVGITDPDLAARVRRAADALSAARAADERRIEIGLRTAMESAPAPGAPSMDQAAAQTQAAVESSIGCVAFTLPAPVTVLSGETANVPFLDERLPAERVW
jgi:hypothetical protein